INSGIYLSTGLLGAWLSDPVNVRLGRRGALMAGSIICLVSNIASALSQTWPSLLAFRVMLGLGLGINTSTASVYVAECAPAAIRGGLAVSWQMFVAFGIFVGFVANAVVYDYGPNTWRWQLAAPLAPTLPLVALLFACPESPAWYLKRGSGYRQSFDSLRRLRNTELQVAKEVYGTYVQRQTSTKQVSEASFFTKLHQLFTIPRNRRATMASYTVMISQQLCGINIVAFYSSNIFSDAGFSTYGALVASCVFGFVNFIGAFPALWTMDTLGRRALLLWTLPLMAVTMFVAGISFSISPESSAHYWLPVALVYLFCAEYSPGMGPVPNSYSAEVFPLSHREIGMSLAVATANIWASVLSLTFPRLLATLQPQGAFMLYAVLNVVALVLVFLFVPETRQRTLDELDEVFSIPTRRFIKYQTTTHLPWMARRYILRQTPGDLKPLLGDDEYRTLTQHDAASDDET
ncbi:MAG: sugar porter family MFS transporter, partial [Terriglobus roseus]|nr:sugar porter family MFS transporter [Terriglobus roseus]